MTKETKVKKLDLESRTGPPAKTLPAAAVKASLEGNWNGVADPDRIAFVKHLCDSLRIPLVQNPFRFIAMKGKTALYAPAEAFELIGKKNAISTPITAEHFDPETSIYTVKVRATEPGGRHTDEMGKMYCGKTNGQDLADMQMKTITKAKRRAIKALMGISVFDEDDLAYMRRHESSEEAPLELVAPEEETQEEPPSEDEEAQNHLMEKLVDKFGSVEAAEEYAHNEFAKPIKELNATEAVDLEATLDQMELTL